MTSSLSGSNSTSSRRSHSNTYTNTNGSSRSFTTDAASRPRGYQPIDSVSYARFLYEYTRQQMDQAASRQTSMDHASSDHRSSKKSSRAIA